MRIAVEAVFTREERQMFSLLARDHRVAWPDADFDDEVEVDRVARCLNGFAENREPITFERVCEALGYAERFVAVTEAQCDPELWRGVVGTEPNGLVLNPEQAVNVLVEARTAQAEVGRQAVAMLRRAKETLLATYANLPGQIVSIEDDIENERWAQKEWRGLTIDVGFEEVPV